MMIEHAPRLREDEFMGQVCELAEIRGWSWVHFRAARTARGWRTPVSGPLGKGWVDLVLVRSRDRRLIFAELKGEGGDVKPEQGPVLEQLGKLEWPRWRPAGAPTIEVFIWWPADWATIEQVLR